MMNYRIHYSVRHVEKEMSFLTKMGFQTLNDKLLFEGGRIVRIESSESPSGIVLLADDPDEMFATFNTPKEAFETTERGYQLTDPDGIGIYLEKKDDVKVNEPKPSLFGKMYEVSMEVENLEKSVKFYENLGFKINFRLKETDRWLGMLRGDCQIGIYEKGVCPHIFNSPALTYFEKDNVARIERIKSMGFPMAAEMKDKEGNLTDAILETPDGLHFFLFALWE